MILVNIIAWLTLILTVIACADGVLTCEDKHNRIISFGLLVGYICTIVAFACR
jgi:hypothetical protein